MRKGYTKSSKSLTLYYRYCIPPGIPALLTEVLLASLLNYAIRYDLFAYTNLKALTSEKTVLVPSWFHH